MKVKILSSLFFIALFTWNCSKKENSDPNIPPTPSNLRIVSFDPIAVQLTWKDNAANEQGFDLEIKRGPGNFTLLHTLDANTESWVEWYYDPQPGWTYTFRIRAYNTFGYSSYSNEFAFTY